MPAKKVSAGRVPVKITRMTTRSQVKSCKNIDCKDITFWARQFVEHFQFLLDFAKRYKVAVPADPRAIMVETQGKWRQVHKNPTLYTSLLLVTTLQAKQRFKTHVLKLACIPDLVNHMMEEADYFKKSVIDCRFSLWDEIKYWSGEHAENINFVLCELPRLIAEDATGQPIPAFLKPSSAKDKVLAEEFKTIAKSENEPKALKTFCEEIVNPMFVTHMQSIETLSSKIPKLPLKPATRTELRKMLQHELNEAKFAYARINSI